MVYGSGAYRATSPDGVPNRRNTANSGNSNGSYQRNEQSGTYQHQQGTTYQPPQLTGGTYAEQQTNVVEDAVRTQIEAETTATKISDQFGRQKQQLQNANDDTWAMRQNVADAQRELKELQQKARMKKNRLYVIIGMLSTVDLMLFFRIVQCGGSFFCRRY
mmetsp:Transcript_12820/g.27650  ORF Transcript_12820/g.27650 Transcript_12820/m.27650 type:complete len:161 (-) Transcript_12820:179-661(-)|eukprot:CAMPEP_0196152606 /NCGR_PEP_ID=MMETSP0910-20130528/35762_1 /TAXON_ID=49265 /ORGANISM="Thalassiosira rotula, Strain GSO102" /LENGTH=160 /DNA_ID=CAMNT_0041416229 /DNA_START=36 /DNA_END=518 /DNA_ORIENTATION=+